MHFRGWAVPLAAGTVLAVIAAQLGNPFIPVGTAEVFTAFLLGAALREAPFTIGAVLVLPFAAYVLATRSDSVGDVLVKLLLFAAFALFNGCAAGAGATWSHTLRNR